MKDSIILEVESLSKFFGGLRALHDYTLQLRNSEIVGIIGPNGAGKTTLFNVITGFIKPTEGSIRLDGKDITNLEPHLIAHAGIARTFQNICLFGNLSVFDNVKLGGQLHERTNLFNVILNLRQFHQYEDRLNRKTIKLLSLFGLERYKEQRARNLAYGDQRRLEIARALATSPRILLLDEPSAGMNPKETHDLLELILDIKGEFGIAMLLIEHNMNLVMPLCERIQVLNYGEKIAEGPPEEIQDNDEVINAYLGDEEIVTGS